MLVTVVGTPTLPGSAAIVEWPGPAMAWSRRGSLLSWYRYQKNRVVGGNQMKRTLSVTCITMATDLFPQNEVGTVSGFAGTFANLGVLLFSLAIGALVTTVGYDPFFIALSLLDLVAAVVLWTVIRLPAPETSLMEKPL